MTAVAGSDRKGHNRKASGPETRYQEHNRRNAVVGKDRKGHNRKESGPDTRYHEHNRRNAAAGKDRKGHNRKESGPDTRYHEHNRRNAAAGKDRKGHNRKESGSGSRYQEHNRKGSREGSRYKEHNRRNPHQLMDLTDSCFPVPVSPSAAVIPYASISAKPDFKKGSKRIFHGLTDDYLAVSVVGIGEENAGYDELEEIDAKKENVRVAAGAGAKALESEGINDIEVESFGDAESAAEGVTLQLWKYDELKKKDKKKVVPTVRYQCTGDGSMDCGWEVGKIKAEAQNLARRLADTPANLMTPTIFAENAANVLGNNPKVTVIARDCAWAKQMNMNAFLGVAKGSIEFPIFLEVHYKGGEPNTNPVVFVGKGITFDSGGISIKPAASMEEMRGDMGGGACVLSSIYAAAKLNLPVNVIGLIPLCENMPSSNAVKPGDVLIAMNGKSIEVVNTDAEGRLILADALHYAASFNPRFVLDIATLTGAMRVALGGAATGVFTNSTELWNCIHNAGVYTGDRMWRFPLWKAYTERVTAFPRIDVSNVGKGKGGGACTAAAFLKEFAPSKNWLHLDIAGVMGPDDDTSYIAKGMTGRPTRTLIQMLSSLQ